MCAAHRGAADGSGYTFFESFSPYRATRAREVPGFDSLGFQPLPQCHPACGVLVLSVRAAFPLVPPPRAPSPRTVFAADVSGLTRFIITRCGLMVLLLGAVAMLLLENATALLVEDLVIGKIARRKRHFCCCRSVVLTASFSSYLSLPTMASWCFRRRGWLQTVPRRSAARLVKSWGGVRF